MGEGAKALDLSLEEIADVMFKAYDVGPRFQKYATALLAKTALESAKAARTTARATWFLVGATAALVVVDIVLRVWIA